MKHQIEMNNLIQFKQLHVTENETTKKLDVAETIHVGNAIDLCNGGVKIISFQFPEGKWVSFENIIDVVKS